MIADVVGRSLDIIKTPDGKIVPGELFPHLMKDFAEIYRFQIVQENINEFRIKLVPNGKINDSTMSQIDKELKSILKSSVRLIYEIVDHIPLTATGKYRVTVSNLSNEKTN